MTGDDGWLSRKRVAHAGGRRIAYVEVDGAGPPLLLLHGFSDSSRSFALVAPHLVGRRLVILDLPGHGGSSPGNGWTPAHLAEDLAAFISATKLEWPVLVGHSLGSMIALEMAASHPGRYAGLALIAGTLRPDLSDDHPVVVGVTSLSEPIAPSDPFLAFWYRSGPKVPAPFLAKLAEEADMPAVQWRAILDGIRGFDLAASQPRIDIPMLILGGDEDHLFARTHHEALATAFPKAAAMRFANCGHNPHWDAPDLVAAAIIRHFPALT